VTAPPIDRAAALAELAEPTTEAARLAEIAHAFPELGSEVAAHPNVYPDLVDWLTAYGSFTEPVAKSEPVANAEPVAKPAPVAKKVTPSAKKVTAPATPRLTHPGLFAGFTFAAAGALAVFLLGFTPAQTIGAVTQLLAGGYSSGYYDGDPYDEGGSYDEGTDAAQWISCPSDSSAVMWAEWDGGATLVCEFSSGGYRMIVASGGTIQESDEVTSTPTGYSSPLAAIAFGGWSLWLPDSPSVSATTWGNTTWGDYATDDDGGDAPRAADGIPACPADSFPLSLSLWSGGWLLTCGTGDGAPTSFEYLDGGNSGSGGHLTYAGGRYCGTDGDGQQVCVSSAPSVVQVAADRYTVEANYFSDSGPGGPGQGTGAYGVEAPGETAAEQVGYLVAILEKSGEARAMVNSVLAPLNACSVSGTDVQNLQTLTQARTDLLAALRSTPVDQVPDGVNLLAQLTNAIELSEQADLGYIDAAQIMASGDCSGGKGTYRNAITIADQAEASKQAFVDAWNAGIAGQFGVRTFTAKDI